MDPEGSVELGQERRLGAMSPRSAMVRARSGVRRGMMAIASFAGVSVLAGCVATTTEDGGGVTEMRQQEAPARGSSGDSAVGATAASTAAYTVDAKLGSADAKRVELKPIEVVVPGTSVTITMQPISPEAGESFYVATTEATWDLYDAFIFNLDTDAGESTEASDAVTRPSKPYVLADRGYGHAGYALLSASPAAVERFVEWLSIKTGRKIRVPTEAEMRYLLESSGIADADARIASGWFEENAEYSTHAVGSKPVDANGLHDIWGNLSEYAVAPDGTWVVMGGSFIDPVADVGLDYRIPFTTDWNADDPQIPKSPWWLASNDWVGVRLVADP